jgi:predicted kinase
MRVIFYLKGLPGSGKSTEALKMLKQFPSRYRRVNKDSIRTMLIGPDFNFKTESMVVNIRDFCIDTALRKGFDVICDDTNLSEKYFLGTCKVAKRIGDIQIVEHYFECPLDVCLERNSKRENPVPEEIIKNMHKKYIDMKSVQQRTVYFPPVVKVFEKNPKLPDAIIADIDGTLALNESGRSYFDSTRVIEDSVNVPVADVVRDYKAKGVTILVLSGRKDDSKEDSETWLKCNNIPYDQILMRATEDSRSDDITKREIYENQIKGKYNVLFVLDDRQKVVNMWRELGLSCFQVNEGNF